MTKTVFVLLCVFSAALTVRTALTQPSEPPIVALHKSGRTVASSPVPGQAQLLGLLMVTTLANDGASGFLRK